MFSYCVIPLLYSGTPLKGHLVNQTDIDIHTCTHKDYFAILFGPKDVHDRQVSLHMLNHCIAYLTLVMHAPFLTGRPAEHPVHP